MSTFYGMPLVIGMGHSSIHAGGVMPTPITRGRFQINHGSATSRQLLSTDSIGNFTLSLTNLVIGSAIQIETQAGAVIWNRTAAAATEVFTIPAYTAGAANNLLRIKVRKGSAFPFYKNYETLATAVIGSISVYVSQIPD